MKFKILYEKLKFKSLQKDLKDFVGFKNVPVSDTKIGNWIFKYYVKNSNRIKSLNVYKDTIERFLSDVEKDNMIYPLFFTILNEKYQIDDYDEFVNTIKSDTSKIIDKFLDVLKIIYRVYEHNGEKYFVDNYKNIKIDKSNIPIKHKNLWN